MPKKNAVVSAIKTIKKTAAKRPVARRSNPGNAMLADATKALSPILPAAASYVGARLVGRILRMTVGQKIAGGRLQKHFGPLGNLCALLSAYYGSKKINAIRPYQQELIIGAGIALFQSILETYIPALSHFADAQPQLTAAPQKVGLAGAHQAIRPRRTRFVVPGELDSEKAIYNQRIAEAQSQNIHAEAQEVDDEYPQSAVNGETIEYVDEIDEAMGDADDDLNSGIFAN